MKTNKERFDTLYEQVLAITETMIAARFPNGRTVRFFAVNNNYDVVEVPITEWLYNDGIYCDRSRPKREDVKKVSEWIASPPPFDQACLRIISDGFNLSLADIDGKRFAWERAPLETSAKELRLLYAPRDGYRPCCYCRRQRKPEDLKQSVIISPNWKDNGYRSPPRDYCKDDSCAGYDQMAHEG